MNEDARPENDFIGYEYKSITVKRDMVDLYADCFPSFGWILEKINPSLTPTATMMKFKRDRKMINKVELTRLQHEFESHANDINRMERSKTVGASTAAFVIGILGTAFIAGSVFAITAGTPNIPLCIVLAIPAFIGWIVPYFCYRRISAKKAEQITPLIDGQYDAIYAVCEKANALLYK